MNLEKHIDKALELYKAAYSKLDVWQMEKQAAFNKHKQEVKRLTREAAVEDNAKLVKEFTDKRKAIEDELKQGISAVEAEYMQEVKAFYQPNGTAIDVADQALLATGILTTDEIVEMILKHAENPTMERIISKYVSEQRIRNLPEDALKAMVRAASCGENEESVFKKFKVLLHSPVNMAAQGLAGTEAFMNTALKADEYAKFIKIELLKVKLMLNDREKEVLRQAEHDQMVARNGGYDPLAGVAED